MVEISSVK